MRERSEKGVERLPEDPDIPGRIARSSGFVSLLESPRVWSEPTHVVGRT